jgi:hypothetical protein
MTGAKNINPSLQHHEDWPARVQMTISAVRLETIRRQTKMNTPWVLCKFRIKTVKSLRSLAIRRMGLDIGVFTFTFPFIMPPHLLCCFFRQEQPFQPWRDRYVTKLFGCHFCGNRDTIFISHLHISGPTTMHTFGIILVLLPEQHAILFAHIILLIVHTEIRHNLFRLVQVFRHVMLCRMRSIIILMISL